MNTKQKVPEEIKLNFLANQIKDICQDLKIDIPTSIKPFINKNNTNLHYQSRKQSILFITTTIYSPTQQRPTLYMVICNKNNKSSFCTKCHHNYPHRLNDNCHHSKLHCGTCQEETSQQHNDKN